MIVSFDIMFTRLDQKHLGYVASLAIPTLLPVPLDRMAMNSFQKVIKTKEICSGYQFETAINQNSGLFTETVQLLIVDIATMFLAKLNKSLVVVRKLSDS